VGKNVAVFVDVANIFYAAKAAGVDIDYVTLLKSATAGRDFVRAYAYTGLDPDNENQRNFHSFLARNNYKVVSKDIRKYGDGKVKANLDIELVVDMMKTARNLDVAIVVSGDGDFAPAIRAVQEMGVRVEVISFRGNTSSDLIEVADIFTDITQLARVEKGSSRSGRRVAGDDEDLSMTEVPDKQTEGTGAGRGRGRSRSRGRAGEAEPVAPRARPARIAAPELAPVVAAGGLTVLPGEKLSRIAPVAAELPEAVEPAEAIPAPSGDSDDEGLDADGRRRRRRRGGRGRGRGRGREQEAGLVPEGEAGLPPAPLDEVDADVEEDEEEEDEVIERPAAARAAPRPTPFGSVWDSQLGVPSAASSKLPPLADDDEDFDEPEIPEYLIAEQRRGQQARGGARGGQPNRGGPRGGRAGYSAAVDRERYGRGGGGGINRYPDVSGRTGVQGGRPSGGGGRPAEPAFGRGERPERFDRQDRSDRPDRQERTDRPARSSEPWSEVPEELQEMLRAQLAQSPKAVAPRPAVTRAPDRTEPAPAPTAEATSPSGAESTGGPPKRRATTRRPPARRASAARSSEAGATGESASSEAGATAESAEALIGDVSAAPAGATGAAPKRRAPARAKATTEATAVSDTATDAQASAPKRRASTRTKATAAEPVGEAPAASAAESSPDVAPKRRATRKKVEPA
jgi:uncharacterized LabA/DUF88 family protein